MAGLCNHCCHSANCSGPASGKRAALRINYSIMTPSSVASHPSPAWPAFGAQEHEEDRDPYIATPPIPTVFSVFLNTNSGMWTKSSEKRLMVPRKNTGAESRTEVTPSGTSLHHHHHQHTHPVGRSQGMGEGCLQVSPRPTRLSSHKAPGFAFVHTANF